MLTFKAKILHQECPPLPFLELNQVPTGLCLANVQGFLALVHLAVEDMLGSDILNFPPLAVVPLPLMAGNNAVVATCTFNRSVSETSTKAKQIK